MSSDSTPRTAGLNDSDYEECPHGNGLTCRDCQLEAEADDATWD